MLAQNGFTKTELLVVLGVISIVGAVASTGWKSYIPTHRLNNAVRELWTTMQLARLMAVKENTTSAVTLDSETCSFEAFIDNGTGPGAVAGNGKRESSERVLRCRPLPPDILVHRITFTARMLRFNSRGMPRGAGSFYLKNRRGEFLGISVGFTGSMTIKKSTNGGKTWKEI